MKSFKTQKGTELPLLNLKGKPYLQVAHRLVWFRELHGNGIIKTSIIDKGGEGKDSFATFKAEIFIDLGQGPVLVATAHKTETRGGFPDYLEKAETGAIGRALAIAGFGTQFTGDELDEGDRLADSPIDPAKPKRNTTDKNVTETTEKSQNETKKEESRKGFTRRKFGRK